MHPFARALSGVSSVSQETCLSLVSSLSLAVCHNARRPFAPQVSARAVGLARLPQPSRLIVDHSVLLPVLQHYPLAMNFVHGIDPDSHLLGGWQLDPSKLNKCVVAVRAWRADRVNSVAEGQCGALSDLPPCPRRREHQ